jgi:hypothetical protein
LLKFPFLFGLFGTPGWDRTSGFQLRRLTLYPLSYGRFEDKSEGGMREKQINFLPFTMDPIGLWIRFRLDFYLAKIEPNLIHNPGQVKMKTIPRFKGSAFRVQRFCLAPELPFSRELMIEPLTDKDRCASVE